MKFLLKKLLAPRRQEYLILNKDLIILEASFSVHRFADRPNEVRNGQDARQGFPELFGAEDILREILKGHKEYFELKGIARSSENSLPLYIDLYITDSQNEENHEPQLLILFEDVTEFMLMKQSLIQRANEANLLLSALVTSKEYIDKIVNSMADALVVTNRSGHIKTVNPSTLELFGYTQEELIGKPLSLIVSDKSFLRQQLQRRNTPYEIDLLKDIEVICEKKNGEQISIAFSCSIVQTDEKGARDFVYIGRDITDRKRAEEETRKAMEKEKELADLKSRFVSMTSHEFRNPLTTIVTSVALLQEDYRSHQDVLDEDTLLYLQMIQTAARQMIDLLNDVLIIGKAEAGKLEFDPVSLDLVHFCSQIVEEIKFSVGNKEAIAFISREEIFMACLDKKLLRQILTNLLSNAIKYSPQGSPVRLELTRAHNEAIFEIQDRGIGISPEDQKRLFESFHRGKNARNISGTGLGLAIVKKSVELQGGHIAISSEVGAGTTVRVAIPIQSDRQNNEEDVIT